MDNLINYSLTPDPLQSFSNWYSLALKLEQNAQAMAVATIDKKHQRPTCRYILFKGMDQGKFTFYTNYLSPKSHDLEDNSEVAMTFYWHVSKKQVRVQGRVKKMDPKESMAYFYSRDRDSQIASYISHQSSIVADKDELIKRVDQVKKDFDGKEIPMPPHWGGYLVDAYEIEFFLYGDFRLNDRFLYEKKDGTWMVSRLEP